MLQIDMNGACKVAINIPVSSIDTTDFLVSILCARLIYWRGFRSFELDQISELEWEGRDCEWATTCKIAECRQNYSENLFWFGLLKTAVHVLENTCNSFWCGFRESKQQSILGYEMVQGCCQRKLYWLVSVDCDSQTKNAMAFCCM